MRFGVCTGIENAALVKQIGYDYFEPGFGALGDLSQEDFDDFKKRVLALDFYPEAMNVMLPGRFQLTGPAADLTPIKPFLESTFARAAQVNNKVVVFGSAGARNLPAGFTDMAKAYQQLEDYLNMAGEIAVRYGINIAIEPLNFAESNIIHFVSEGAYLAARVGNPNVRCLADYYHMALNKEDCEDIVGFAHRMEHCHIARMEGRAYPLPGDGQDYAPFFQALKKAGYDKRVSVEGTAYNGIEQDAPAALALLKELA